ncbi:hypothetical protein IWX63_003180 [Arthrobacter sp. CAN_A2]|uniref:hypothetical protein n=1 Tax=Arthrobacter sp. CAN_A2 TaxID=2787718 RepID=UPI0018F01C11
MVSFPELNLEHLDRLPAAFEHARGERADKDWAELVIGRLSIENINTSLVRAELTRAVTLVRDSGESPPDLFGEPFDYVRAQIEQWRNDGAPLLPVEPATRWRDVPVLAATVATVIVAMIGILELISGNWTTSYTLGKLLAPSLIAVTALVSLTAFETRLQRTRRLWAVLVALLPALLGVGITVAAFIIGNNTPLLTGPLWWYAILMIVHALLAIVLHRYIPDDQTPRIRRPSTPATPGTAPHHGREGAQSADADDQWALQLAGILRLRLEMPEKEVRATIAEARQHTEHNGSTLHEEFGPPNDYASRLPRSTSGRRMRERWARIAWVVALPAFGYLAFEGLQHGWAWDNVRWFMAIAFTASCLTVLGYLRHRPPTHAER